MEVRAAGDKEGKGLRPGGCHASPMPFMRDERGFAAPAAAVAILLVCALLFVCMHGYNVGTRSGQAQYVADAGALAADNVVAEFVTAGQVLDAVLLSLGLLAVTAYAASAVASFIPGGAGVASSLVDVGTKLMKARDDFASSASKGLEQVQKALPALCAVRASQCIEANARASGISYLGTAVAFPASAAAEELVSSKSAKEAMGDVEAKEGEVQDKSKKYQQALARANEAKQRAWLADCGSDGMCMKERASKLAGLSGAVNPSYASVDDWSFDVALQRAKRYYAARLQQEPGASASDSPELVAESVARQRFYEYALKEVSKGSVSSDDGIPCLMRLARNKEQVKQTYLYTERIYPVSKSAKGKLKIHAYAGCPEYGKGSPCGVASAQDADGGSIGRCDTCKFSIVTLGRVPSASTSISNGFEYHYLACVEAAEEYRAAMEEQSDLGKELERESDDISQKVADAVASLSKKRYSPQPPGRYGCVCIVIAPSLTGGSLPFAGADDSIPARVAVSGATLAADAQDGEGDIVTDIAAGLMPQSSVGSGFLHLVLGSWGSMLKAYAGGVGNVKAALNSVAGSIPLVGTELSSKLVSKISSALDGAGLAPANLSSHKPVLVNTFHILKRDGGRAASALLAAKRAADAYGAASVDDLSVLQEEALSVPVVKDALSGDSLVLANIPLSKLGHGLKDVRVSIPAPEDLFERFQSARDSLGVIGGLS